MTEARRSSDDARKLRTRYWVEVCLAVVAAVLAVITAIVPDWIERLTGAQPDSGAGELEWLLAIIPAVIAVFLGVLARRDWRRLVTA
ncbi:MAG: hypothetical protein ACRDWY_13255 [Actinomycetes bacterium]